MPARRRLAASIALALPLTLAFGACKKGGGGGGDDALAVAAIDARMPGPVFRPVDRPPGFIEGGLAYVAVRPAMFQKWFQELPLPPDAASELAEASRELGVDLRTGDVLGHFWIDPAGTVSMTLARPMLGEHDRLLDGLANLPPPKPDAFPGVDGDNGQILELARQLGAVGMHFRIHVPVTAIDRLRSEIARIPPKSAGTPAICGELGPSELCIGDAYGFVIARGVDKALVIDAFAYPSGLGSIDDAERKAAIEAGIRAPAAPAPVALRGDLAAYIDAGVLPSQAKINGIADLARARRWADDAFGEMVERHRKSLRALESLRETRRLLKGARYEVALSDEAVRATFAWEPVDGEAAKTLEKLLKRSGPALDMPTIDGLCTDSMACFRTSGLPGLTGLAELATGVYAAPFRDFSRVVDDAGEFGGLAIALETWPNLLSAGQRWPKEEARGPEAAIISQVLASIDNVAGAGGSLRSLQAPKGMGMPQVDFVAYLRVTGAELGMVRGMLALAQQKVEPMQLASVEGKVESVRIPEDVPATIFLSTDPKQVKAGDREVEVGWLAVADAPDRLSWLLGLARDPEIEPVAYFEIP
ncbi:MAG: hypothetical protein H6710_05075 [Myxococcales bacterium]|nr:hypothetical protein [Myxococcales bacterium]